MTKKKYVLIDCDPGHDDIMAILSAIANPDIFHILGITTVCGNNLVPLITENMLNVLEYIHREDIPVCMGADKPLFYPPSPQAAHGYNGLEGFEFPKLTIKTIDQNVITFMKEKILSSPEPVTIMALAPLTNIATLLKEEPTLINQIEQIVVMGGSWYRGNVIPHAEFNIYADPHAAKEVFSGKISTVIIPLECCDDCTISEETVQSWTNDKRYLTKMVGGIMDFFAIYGRKHQRTRHTIFDLAVTEYLLQPEIFQGESCDCEVILTGEETRGQTIFTPNPNSKIHVLKNADTNKFEKQIISDIHKLSTQIN